MYIYEGVGMLKRVIHSMVHRREALRYDRAWETHDYFCRQKESERNW